MKRRVLFLAAAALLFPLGGLGDERKPSGELPKVMLHESTINSASLCGKCHIDIYNLWKQSLHSKTMKDPAFLAAFEDKRIQGDERNRRHCLQCHAPALHYNPSLELGSEVVQEGVTCDFCHSIQEVKLQDPEKPFVVNWGKLKRGPFKDIQSPAHDAKQSPIFENGELCGGCHEMRNLKGTPIITTYSEWKERYYKKVGQSTCVSCHMPVGAGFTVTADNRTIKRRLNLHNFAGGHSRVQLHDALEVKLIEETWLYGKMKIKLGVTNAGVGHSIPTGNPLRKIAIDFRAYGNSPEPLYKHRVELGKRFATEDGKPLTEDVEVLLDASKVLEDNRIAPGETRELTFEFKCPSEKILVEATVLYLYENAAAPNLSRREPMITFSKVVNRSESK